MSLDYQRTVEKTFPGAFEGRELTAKALRVLESQGITPENTVFGFSTCPDEVNRLVTSFNSAWKTHFPLGGLAGFPFVGREGFSALSHHVPENGHLFILFASHVGIDNEGKFGGVIRRGQTGPSTCCGSAMAAYNALTKDPEFDQSSAGWQQSYVISLLKKNWERIQQAQEPILELTNVLYERIKQDLHEIIPDDLDMNMAMLGGIQINTPYENSNDYFLVKDFQIINMKQNENKELLTKL